MEKIILEIFAGLILGTFLGIPVSVLVWECCELGAKLYDSFSEKRQEKLKMQFYLDEERKRLLLNLQIEQKYSELRKRMLEEALKHHSE